MKRLILSAAFVALGVGVMAQGQHGAGHDPDKMAAGGGTLPAGWSARLDNGSPTPTGVSVEQMGSGIHVKSGPAGIYFKKADTFSGPTTVSAVFTQMEPAAHPEAYGVFIGGSDLQGANQKYTYFVIRQDGKFLVKRRAGTATPTVTNWTENAAIDKADASGKMTNTVAIQTDSEKAHFLVNGKEVSAVPIADVDASGIAGIRVNHNLNVQITGFTTRGTKTATQK
jgi:hypothetical protein